MSLILQIILIGLGNRRKYSAGNKIAFVLWLPYLCADSIAIISLGILSCSQGKCSDAFLDLDYVVMAFWAPFLLLQLGGPDTITAYSLEDNELWLQHLLRLIVEVAVAIYIFVRSMKPTQLNLLAIPMLVAGLIKFGERTWVLRSASNSHLMEEGDALIIAYDFFLTSKHLRPFFQRITCKNAFRVIEMELGFMHDVLFTKATIVHFWGGVLRSISFSSTTAALTAFCLIDLSGYSSVNVMTSLILLVGAIGLEMYAILVLLSSDWTMLWIKNLRAETRRLISRVHSLSINKRWSNCVAQYNMLSSCLENWTVRCCGLVNWIHKQLEDYQDDQVEPVSDYLKKSVFNQLLEKSLKALDFRLCKELCSYRGKWELEKHECIEKLGWSIDVDGNQNPDNANSSRGEAIRVILNYMMFILMKRPFMLPDGIGQIRLQDTHAEAEDFVQERKIIDKSDVCKKLLEVDTRISPIDVKGDWSKSEVMMEVWIEMLCYVACHCQWNHHAQQLRRGGELLIHVWILMTHLDISEQFQISQGHARTKLRVK
ncbi:hypothetical protein BT93_E1986 [Corymbia citriodora subsp. variegata]|nr:hypothetical protein BT93_E1986 [Corymbia citriodora subsp. variegata]